MCANNKKKRTMGPQNNDDNNRNNSSNISVNSNINNKSSNNNCKSICFQNNESNDNKKDDIKILKSFYCVEENSKNKMGLTSVGSNLKLRSFSPRKHSSEIETWKKRECKLPSRSSNIRTLQEKLKNPSKLRFNSPIRKDLFQSDNKSNEVGNSLSSKSKQIPSNLSNTRSSSPSHSDFKAANNSHYTAPSRATIRPSVRSIIKSHNRTQCKSPDKSSGGATTTTAWIEKNGINSSKLKEPKSFIADGRGKGLQNDVNSVIENNLGSSYRSPMKSYKSYYSLSNNLFENHTCKIEIHNTDKEDISLIKVDSKDENRKDIKKHYSNTKIEEDNNGGKPLLKTSSQDGNLSSDVRENGLQENSSHFAGNVDQQRCFSPCEKGDDNVRVVIQDTPPPSTPISPPPSDAVPSVFTYFKGNNKLIE